MSLEDIVGEVETAISRGACDIETSIETEGEQIVQALDNVTLALRVLTHVIVRCAVTETVPITPGEELQTQLIKSILEDAKEECS